MLAGLAGPWGPPRAAVESRWLPWAFGPIRRGGVMASDERPPPNRYAGRCAACGDPVQRYEGVIEWAGAGRYHVLHPGCVDSPERSAAHRHRRQVDGDDGARGRE